MVDQHANEELHVEMDPNSPRLLRLKDGRCLHMYISAIPCGDAAIFKASGLQTETLLPSRTGAKVLAFKDRLPRQSEVESTQETGCTRRKP
eukprot:scaffold130339_cov38-Prasinocladus_malaysianus.AAC.1